MKVGVVLEGGGLRGAYTAGSLAWFLDNQIEFDYGVGISSGAVFLCEYLTKNREDLESIAVKYAGAEFDKGLKPLLKEGNFVAYDHLFDDVLRNTVPINMEKLKESSKVTHAEFGLYDMELGQTTWHNVLDIEPDMKHLKAACTIPAAGKKVRIEDKEYLDGGIIEMIPIQRSIEQNVDRHIIITTKPIDYERKPQGFLSRLGIKLLYNKFPHLHRDVTYRHERYYEQRALVDDLVEKGEAIEIRPSKNMDVGRFGGDISQMKDLFDLGYQDTEAKREEIEAFFL